MHSLIGWVGGKKRLARPLTPDMFDNKAPAAPQAAAAPRPVTPVHTPIKGGSNRRRRTRNSAKRAK